MKEGYLPKPGGIWQGNTIKRVLRNEKYAGDLLLQKSFVADHISKKQRMNKGELPMYYVEGNHEAIIDSDTFQEVQNEIVRRAKKYKICGKQKTYPFTKKIQCELCGKNYKRKTTRSGTKYEKVVWICSTWDNYGKKYCSSSRIPEEILENLSAEVLNIPKFDEEVFSKKIKKITVPCKGELKFIFNDGTEIIKIWDYPSRSESWTEEMKKMASKNEINRQERVKKCGVNTCGKSNSGNH